MKNSEFTFFTFPTLFTLFFLAGMVAAYHMKFDGQISALMHVGRLYVHPSVAEDGVFQWGTPEKTGTGFEGYDGQFFYYLARHGWEAPEEVFDNRPYRAQRMLYPLLVSVFSVGSPQAIPWMMVAVNVAALTGVVIFLAAFASAYGRSKWLAVTGVMAVGLLLSVTYDVADPLAVLCVVGAAWATHRQSWVGTAVWLALGLLTREQTLIVLPLFAWWWRWEWRKGLALVGLPLAAWGSWQMILRVKFGVWPIVANQFFVWAWPGQAWVERLAEMVRYGHGHCEGPEGLFLLWFMATTMTAVREWWINAKVGARNAELTNRPSPIGLPLILSQAGFGLVLNHVVWESLASSSRVMGVLAPALMISECEAPSKTKRVLLALSVVIGISWVICDVR